MAANDSIPLPITKSVAVINNIWSLIYIPAIRYTSSSRAYLAITFLALFLTAQVRKEAAT